MSKYKDTYNLATMRSGFGSLQTNRVPGTLSPRTPNMWTCGMGYQ